MDNPVFINHSKTIKGLIEVKLDNYYDDRGCNFEIYNSRKYKNDFFPEFNLDSCSSSKKGVIRGFHGERINDKLIHCLYGEIQFFAIDKRENSPTYNNVIEFLLNNKTQIFVPHGVVNAHQCISENCVFFYKWKQDYCPIQDQIFVKWNDPFFNLKWKIENPILSNRDR